MKKCIFVIVLLCNVTLLGCNPNNITKGNQDKVASSTEDAGITGYVMKKDDSRILVVNPEVMDFSSTGGIEEYYNAIWFSNAPKDINLGDQVKVWFEYTEDSYPAQSEIKRLEVINIQKPEGADLSESEALNKFLSSEDNKVEEVSVVKSIDYDLQTDTWDIEIKVIWEDTIHEFQIEDK